MVIKFFTLNENKKIEFTRQELKTLLDEIYSEGYNEGRKNGEHYYYYSTPYYPSPSKSPWYYSPTITCTTETAKDYKSSLVSSSTCASSKCDARYKYTTPNKKEGNEK